MAVALTAVVALASWMPALRAAGVEPSAVPREDQGCAVTATMALMA